jgi:hypothetical protein
MFVCESNRAMDLVSEVGRSSSRPPGDYLGGRDLLNGWIGDSGSRRSLCASRLGCEFG